MVIKGHTCLLFTCNGFHKPHYIAPAMEQWLAAQLTLSLEAAKLNKRGQLAPFSPLSSRRSAAITAAVRDTVRSLEAQSATAEPIWDKDNEREMKVTGNGG